MCAAGGGQCATSTVLVYEKSLTVSPAPSMEMGQSSEWGRPGHAVSSRPGDVCRAAERARRESRQRGQNPEGPRLYSLSGG